MQAESEIEIATYQRVDRFKRYGLVDRFKRYGRGKLFFGSVDRY